MALVPVTMDCGQGTRFTDSFGGCNSFAFATIGTASEFRGPTFSMMYRFRLHTGSLTSGQGAFGVGPGGGRCFLEVAVSGSNFVVSGKILSTGCGSVTVFSFTKPKNTTEHSVAWTYDANGDYHAYYDGVEQSTGASPCSDIANPSAITDILRIAGNTNFDGTEVLDVDRPMFSSDIAPASQILDIHTTCSSF